MQGRRIFYFLLHSYYLRMHVLHFWPFWHFWAYLHSSTGCKFRLRAQSSLGAENAFRFWRMQCPTNRLYPPAGWDFWQLAQRGGEADRTYRPRAFSLIVRLWPKNCDESSFSETQPHPPEGECGPNSEPVHWRALSRHYRIVLTCLWLKCIVF